MAYRTPILPEAHRLLTHAYTTVRANVQRIGEAARGVAMRVADRAEAVVGAKIKRRVKPPIVAALALAGAALAVAAYALFRRRK